MNDVPVGYKMTRLSRYHVGEMAELHEQAFESGWSEQDFVANLYNERDDVLGLVEPDEEGKDIVRGFILIRTIDDQSEIITLVVDPNARRRGNGLALLHAAERTAKKRGADIIFLEVAKDNPSAIALYKKKNYVQCGTRKAYYRREKGRVDALLLQKKLA